MSVPETERATEFYRYYSERGADKVAEELSALLRKPITGKRVKGHGRKRQPPKEWRDALRIADDEPPPISPPGDPTDGEPSEGEATRRAELPPRPPEGTKLQPPPPALSEAARKRLREIHVFAGGAIATAADADGFQAGTGPGGGIADLWTQKADPIAAAWIAWAEEGNRFAQSVVRLMSTGGAGGELVIGYLSVLGGTAYILGHLPDNDATRFAYGRYSRYRAPEPAPERDGDSGGAGAQGNGAAPVGSPDSLVDASAPVGF